MKTPILGSSYVARSINAANSRMVNLYPEIIPEAGKEAGYLSRAPGLRLITAVGAGPVRGMWTYGGNAYIVSGAKVYRVDPDWAIHELGTVTGSGPVSMADNGTQLFIACNGPSYIYNAVTNIFQQIADPDFPGAVCVSFLDGYFVFNEPSSQKLWITSLLDGLAIDPLEFVSAEGNPDNIVALMSDHREMWVFGTNTIEVWYDAGTTDFPLARVQGAYNEIGCAATYSVAKLDNGLFWLGADARGRGIVYRSNGYSGIRISTHAVEWQIQECGDLSSAIGYTYQQDGHSFYVLILPQANTTWVYDVSTQVWHERAGWYDGSFKRHRSNCQMTFDNKVIVGDYGNGNIYTFDMKVFADNDQPQKWLRSWRALPIGKNDLKRTAQHSLQLDCEVGMLMDRAISPPYISTETPNPIITETNGLYVVGEDGQITNQAGVLLRWSDDGGHTWSNYHFRTMGALGATGTRVIWRRLGMSLKLRDRVYEISGTDPIKIAIMGAQLVISGTNA